MNDQERLRDAEAAVEAAQQEHDDYLRVLLAGPRPEDSPYVTTSQAQGIRLNELKEAVTRALADANEIRWRIGRRREAEQLKLEQPELVRAAREAAEQEKRARQDAGMEIYR